MLFKLVIKESCLSSLKSSKDGALPHLRNISTIVGKTAFNRNCEIYFCRMIHYSHGKHPVISKNELVFIERISVEYRLTSKKCIPLLHFRNEGTDINLQNRWITLRNSGVCLFNSTSYRSRLRCRYHKIVVNNNSRHGFNYSANYLSNYKNWIAVGIYEIIRGKLTIRS